MTIARLVSILEVVSQCSPVLALVLAIRTRPLLWWYALLAVAVDTITLALRQGHLSYHWLGNCFFAAEFLVLSAYYRPRLGRTALLQTVTALVFAGYAVSTVRKGVDVLNLPGAAVFCVVYLVYALLDFYGILRQQRAGVLYLEQSRGFWVNTAVLFYAAATCVMFLFYQDILASNPVGRLYWASFFLSMNILKQLLIATAMRAKYA